jgi:hypothetical protein
MTKTFAMAVSLALIVTVAVSPVWAVGDKVRSDNAAGPAGTTGGGEAVTNRGETVGPNDETLGVLTDEEIGYITYIREEEKLARDVYITLYDLYPEATIFKTISESEQRHMDAIKSLIEKHGLQDPVEDDTVGNFANPVFTDLYKELVENGESSNCDALYVGIGIEELDIEDIEDALGDKNVTARDVIRVFNNLLNGSYNHLNAFDSRFETNNCE